MIVFYRMCDIPSTNPAPIYQENKARLNRLCLESFVNTYADIKPRIVFLNDHCPSSYETLERLIVPKDWHIDIVTSERGINGSCIAQYDLAREMTTQNDECILFQECDYFHLAPITEHMIHALRFVSPYDHPDKYERGEVSKIVIADNHHFKVTESTTSTFATTRADFLHHAGTFYQFGYIDHERWLALRAQGVTLYSPIPTLATHMVASCLSPAISWNSRFSQL